MSLRFLILAVILSLPMLAQATDTILGRYLDKKPTIVMVDSKESCQELRGNWVKKDEVCLIKASNEAIVSRNADQYQLQIKTTGSGNHTCEFKASAVLAKNTLVSKVKAETYNYETDSTSVVTCEVRAKIYNGMMDISTNQLCMSFCGANAWLDVSGLKKI